jgi:hypothetical protein
MKALAEGGAYSTTWYETVGPRGLATIDPDDARLPAGSRGGLVFPIYHVIRDLSEHRRASLLACTSDDPLRVEAMAVRSGDRTSVLVANLQPVRRAVELRLELPARSAPVTVRRLNTQTGRRAMLDPQGFRRQLRSHPSDGNVVRIDLLAYEYSRFEFEHQSDRGG